VTLRNTDIKLDFDGEHKIHHLDGVHAEIAKARINWQRPGSGRLPKNMPNQSEQAFARSYFQPAVSARIAHMAAQYTRASGVAHVTAVRRMAACNSLPPEPGFARRRALCAPINLRAREILGRTEGAIESWH